MKAILFFASLVSAQGSQVMCANDADYKPELSIQLSGFELKCSMINSNSYLPNIQDGASATKCMQVYQVMGVGPETHSGHILGMAAKVCCSNGLHKCSDYVTNVCIDPTQFTYDGTSTWPVGGCEAAAGPIDKTLLDNDGNYTADCTQSWLAGATNGDVAATFFQALSGCCGDKGVHCGDVVITKTKPDCDPNCVTTKGTLEIMLSEASMAALTSSVTAAITILKKALAAIAGVDPVAVTIASMWVEGTKVARRLSMTVDMTSGSQPDSDFEIFKDETTDSQPDRDSQDDRMTEAMTRRLSTDKNVTVGWEINHTELLAPSLFTETKLKENIESEAAKAGLTNTNFTFTITSAKCTIIAQSSGGLWASISHASAITSLTKGLVSLIGLASSRMIWLQ